MEVPSTGPVSLVNSEFEARNVPYSTVIAWGLEDPNSETEESESEPDQ